MRIRKHSGALFTSSSCIASCIAISTGHGFNGRDEEFLLPLVAAVMDVQQAEDKISEGDHGTHTRPTHNWRNALQLQRSGEGNSKSQALQYRVEGKKADWRWNLSVRNQWDNIGLSAKEGTQGALLMKEDTSSSAEKEIMGGRDEEWKLPKPGRLETGTSWRQQKKLSVHSVKRKRSKDDIKGWKDDDTKSTKKLRQETYLQQEDRRKVDEKAMPNKRYSNNNKEAEGSQCRRRNGRGWRCSQRTLVGYSLCEHHLGKGRLRSINSKNSNGISTGIVNNKVGTCKLKELRLIDASRSCNVQVNPDQQKSN